MKSLVRKEVLVVLAAWLCGTVSAQSMRWAENNAEFCRKLSDSVYVSVNSNGSLGMASYKVKNNQFWMVAGDVAEYRGYCTYSNNEYTYFDRDNNIVASYVPSQGRYYMHSAKGNTIFKSVSYAVLNNGVLIPGDDSPVRYTVEKGFDPIVVGFILLVR